MRFVGSFGGVADALVKTCKIGATVYSGGPVMRDTNVYGEVIHVTTTGSADAFGLALTSGTYATSAEATVDVVCNPFGILQARISGDGTTGTALSAATKHVLTQTSASTTVITSSDGYSNSRDGGTVIVLTGANAGLSRVATSHVDATSATVTVAFPNSVAVGDKVVVVPYSIGSHKVQTTGTNFREADGSIAIGTGIDCAVTDVKLQYPINSTNPEVLVYLVLHDTIWNPID